MCCLWSGTHVLHVCSDGCAQSLQLVILILLPLRALVDAHYVLLVLAFTTLIYRQYHPIIAFCVMVFRPCQCRDSTRSYTNCTYLYNLPKAGAHVKSLRWSVQSHYLLSLLSFFPFFFLYYWYTCRIAHYHQHSHWAHPKVLRNATWWIQGHGIISWRHCLWKGEPLSKLPLF